jgi:aspartate/methionine/tyrosine aminotransferase
MHICEAAKNAIDDGKYFAYPPVAGYQDLREALLRNIRKKTMFRTKLKILLSPMAPSNLLQTQC